MFPAFIGGAIGGLVGAAVWAAVAFFFQYEIGWIAWGIGILVGFGVAVGNRGQTSRVAGFLAGALAVLSIAVGKYAAVRLLMPDLEGMMAQAVEWTQSDEFMTTSVAFDLIQEKEAAGQNVAWPAGVQPEFAETAEDFPPGIWAAASASWDRMTEEERAQYREQKLWDYQSGLDGFRAQIANASYLDAFGAMDLLFVGLAIMTAVRIAGRQREDEPVAAAGAAVPGT